MGQDISGHIRGFDRDFKAEEMFRPGLDTLRDGVYTFEILDAEGDIVKAGDQNKAVVRIGLCVLETAEVVEQVYWLESQQNCNTLGHHLDMMGFSQFRDTDSFSADLATVLRMGALVGLRFRGKKITEVSKKTSKEFAKLYVNAPAGRAGADAGNGQTRTTTPAATQQQRRTTAPVNDPAWEDSGDDIPFGWFLPFLPLLAAFGSVAGMMA